MERIPEEESKALDRSPAVSPGKKPRSSSLDAEGSELQSPTKAPKQTNLRQELKDAEKKIERLEALVNDRMARLEDLFGKLMGESSSNNDVLRTAINTLHESVDLLVTRVQVTEERCARGEEILERTLEKVKPMETADWRPGREEARKTRSTARVDGDLKMESDSNDGMETSMPTSKEMKFQMERFAGTEIYPGLGYGFERWRKVFERKLRFAEGKRWPEEARLMRFVDALGQKMHQHYESNLELWIGESGGDLTLDFVLDKFEVDFGTRVTETQVLLLLQKEKLNTRSWQEHMSYVQYLNHLNGGRSGSLVLENIVKYANKNYTNILMGQVNMGAKDPVAEAKRLVEFIETHIELRQAGRRPTVNTVQGGGGSKKCFGCGDPGHLRRDCPKKGKIGDSSTTGKQTNVLSWHYALTADDDGTIMQVGGPCGDNYEWLLDTGSSEHVVGDLSLLTDVVDEEQYAKCAVGRLRFTHRGTLTLVTTTGIPITVSNVRFAPGSHVYILSLVTLLNRGAAVSSQPATEVTDGHGNVLFEVTTSHNVWLTEAKPIIAGSDDGDGHGHARSTAHVFAVANAARGDEASHGDAPLVKDTLANLHRRLGHVAYPTLLKMAKDKSYGIELTDTTQPTCFTCAKGKQTRTKQSKQSTNSSVAEDRIGGVIASDVKGPLTPRDRYQNRYIIVFIDYKSNFMAAFTAPTKAQATAHFKDFKTEFELAFGVRLHILRTCNGIWPHYMVSPCVPLGVTT